ncbi:hypothetical protein C095_05765 [Fusobacterium necrophorum subsp. funduliforme B35]|uniref:Uncharacterized protein n=1 Tax=Fusobacterium necrophorum subsp. funduliforme B35 TaxID=1226633 RepID=A0A0B4EJQ7_9FUSO|nr:hypothetical protein C095_05765 [Fusobacterium necrophorum subsp. funduliforme B35]
MFLYALKNKKINKHTLFRYVYIYDVVCDYLGNYEKINENFIVDKDLGINNVLELTAALNEINTHDYIDIKASFEIYVKEELINYVDSMYKSSSKIKEDLNRILYFVEIISSYSEDVILAVFFSEPNVEDAISRGKKSINLSNNKLKELLLEFENIAINNFNNKLDKYDVFTSWLDYVFEKYLKGKSDEK